jgi:hypothetical protein
MSEGADKFYDERDDPKTDQFEGRTGNYLSFKL